MADKTIKGMRKGELLNLLDATVDQINQIREAHGKILEIEQFIANNASVTTMRDMQGQAVVLLGQIREFHRELLDGEESTKSEVEKFKSEVEEKRNAWEKTEGELGEVEDKLLGYTEENDAGEEVHHPGLYEKIVREFNEYSEKHDHLYNEIDTVLMSGATTVSLAKDFGEQASEYKKSRVKWQWGQIGTLVSAISYSAVFFDSASKLNIEGLLVSLVQHLPVLTFFIWLVVFIGNRYAENKKLEESYKHKEVMAKSFTGYKKSISELSVEDGALLVKLMDNLLDAIQKDASNFLTSKGENHPLVDAAKRSKKAASKDGNPENP